MIHSLAIVKRCFLFVLLSLVLFLFCAEAPAEEIQIVALGTSFTVGKGVWPKDAWPARLEKMLRAGGENVQVINQGVNGDTTRDLLRRVGKSVPEGAQIVIFEYAIGNDHRRGITIDDTVKNSEKIISQLVGRNIQVLLVIRGRDQAELRKRTKWFSKIVSKYNILYLAIEQPESSLLPDRQHPTTEAHGLIAASMVSPVKKLIARVKAERQVNPTPQ
jgi:acyl-CoA thioesterase-1